MAEEDLNVPNETWSERFEREFEAGVALLRRRPLLAVIFAGALIFFAWHQFFKNKESFPNAPPISGPQADASVPRKAADVAPAKIEIAPKLGEQAISATAPPLPSIRSDKGASSASQHLPTDSPPDRPAGAETASLPMDLPLSTVTLTPYFDRSIVIGATRKEVAEKNPNATWGEGGLGIFASISTKFLGQFPGIAVLFFSNDVVTQVNFLYGFSGSTMRNYRLHGTEDDWQEKITTNGEDMTYSEATGQCASFHRLRGELIRKFGAAKSIQNIPFAAPENDPRTKKYTRPVEEQFDATFIAEDVNLHILAYDIAFIREQTHTSMAKDKLSNRTCSIRAEFIKNIKKTE